MVAGSESSLHTAMLPAERVHVTIVNAGQSSRMMRRPSQKAKSSRSGAMTAR